MRGKYNPGLNMDTEPSHNMSVTVVCLLTSPDSDGADCPKAWLLIRTRLFPSPPPPADIPPAAPPHPPGGPCQVS